MTDFDAVAATSTYDVVYTEAATSDRSAMPLGNGEVAVSIWATVEGVVKFYVARSDALSETDRTLKMGTVEVALTPNPFQGRDFRQRLNLADGSVEIEGEGCRLVAFVSQLRDVIYLEGNFHDEVRVEVRHVSWRKEERELPSSDVRAFGGWKEAADEMLVGPEGIFFYHRNGPTVVEHTARLHGFGDRLDEVPDRLTDRVFGGLVHVSDGSITEDDGIVLEGTRSLSVQVVTRSEQEQPDCFLNGLFEESRQAEGFQIAHQATTSWWNHYWEDSYVFVEGDRVPAVATTDALRLIPTEPGDFECAGSSVVTRSYLLTRYMFACCSRGAFPMLYNGLLFNLTPAVADPGPVDKWAEAYTAVPGTPTADANPDDRPWCTEQLWQNIRWPYFSMLARNETTGIRTLFAYYESFWPVNRLRAQRHYGAAGQHVTEMTLTCGLLSPTLYGEDREGKDPRDVSNMWGGMIQISPGLELLDLMLDFYDYTGDESFLSEELLPFAMDVCAFVFTRFENGADGRLTIGPIHDIETYRDAYNPMPVVAGLRSVIGRLSQIDYLDEDLRTTLNRYFGELPELPHAVGDQGKVFTPAAVFNVERFNVEAPEFYATFPFRVVRVGDPLAEQMRRTVSICAQAYGLDKVFPIGDLPTVPSFSGWHYLGVVAARLGMTDVAGRVLEENCAQANPGMRFPAMWGPIYDGTPDADHGGNILALMQEMLLQVRGGQVLIAPALPSSWSARFKLHIDSHTHVVVHIDNGALKEFEVHGGREDRVFSVIRDGAIKTLPEAGVIVSDGSIALGDLVVSA